MKRKNSSVAKQIKRKITKVKIPSKPQYEGNTEFMFSTGSTLLDLAISGGRVRGGGIPSGILVEVFGPSGTGKTVLLCELAGSVKRKGGQVMFNDPEARLNKQFASIFDFEIDEGLYSRPNTVPEVFEPVRKWKPDDSNVVNGIFADSLAALSTNMEMEGDDKYGMRRAKEFSEELRKTCRVIADKNYLMACSNQVREKADAGKYEMKWISPGGQAVPFYSSLRLRMVGSSKLKNEKTIKGKNHTRVYGIETTVEVFKSSIWQPYRLAPLTIVFDYGIDDIRQNLKFVKANTKSTVYTLKGEKLGQSINDSIQVIEKHKLENELKEEVIDVWEDIEQKLKTERKPKRR